MRTAINIGCYGSSGDQRFHDAFHLLPNPGDSRIARFGQTPQFAHQVRPATQAVFPGREVQGVLDRMQGVCVLLARLLDGSGMRLIEGVRLRVKDLDFEQGEIVVRDGKDATDRLTMLPETRVAGLREHPARRKLVFKDDLQQGQAGVCSPYALERKYPGANKTGGWQRQCSGGRPVDQPDPAVPQSPQIC